MTVKGYLAVKAAHFVKDHWEVAVCVIIIPLILIIMAIPLMFSVFLPHVEYDKVDQYKKIAKDANIPFDQLLMVDIVKHNRENYEVTEKGLKTAALDFYVLTVDEYEIEYYPTPTPAPGVTPTPGYVREYDWVYVGTYTYVGSEEILAFLSNAGYHNIINKSFSQIYNTLLSLDRSERYEISIDKKNYRELISGYDEDIVLWAEEMLENGVVRELYK